PSALPAFPTRRSSDLDHPYFATKHESERLVRETCPVPWRVYRPSLVVGRSDNGEMDKVDGPYYFFTWLKRLAALRNPAPVALPLDRKSTRLNSSHQII